MMPPCVPQDLIVLAADLSMQRTLEAVLKRPKSLGIRKISYSVIQQPHYDSGVLQSGHRTLQSQNKNYRHALAICDRHGCGKESLSRDELEKLIEDGLSHHWGDSAAAIVIDPELENWLWANSPHVAEEIGWTRGISDLRAWLHNAGFLPQGQSKPSDPKAAMQRVLRLTKKHSPTALFQAIAKRVSLQRCVDPAFLKLKETLRRWFPAANA
jgi:hypothetical protein